jgi:hypothetical protein
MKDPYDVLREKEQEIARVRKEVDALRIVAKLLAEDSSPMKDDKVDLRKVVDMS